MFWKNKIALFRFYPGAVVVTLFFILIINRLNVLREMFTKVLSHAIQI